VIHVTSNARVDVGNFSVEVGILIVLAKVLVTIHHRVTEDTEILKYNWLNRGSRAILSSCDSTPLHNRAVNQEKPLYLCGELNNYKLSEDSKLICGNGYFTMAGLPRGQSRRGFAWRV